MRNEYPSLDHPVSTQNTTLEMEYLDILCQCCQYIYTEIGMLLKIVR